MPDESDSPDTNRIFPGVHTWTSHQLVRAIAREVLALAFGSPIVRRASVVGGFPGPRASIRYAGGVLRIPALGVEVGGVGFGRHLEDRRRQMATRRHETPPAPHGHEEPPGKAPGGGRHGTSTAPGT